MDEPNNPITPHPTTPPTSPPQPDTPSFHSSTPIPPQPDTHPSHSSTPIPTSAQTQSHAQTVDSHTLIPINNSSQNMPTHPMVTRAKAGIFKLLKRMNCHVTTTSPLPRSHVHALHDSLSRYKSRLVANGRSQQQGIDCDETFSPVVKPATIRTVLSLVVSRDWPIHQLDVKNFFLHGHLSETIYMHQPPGFVDPNKSNYVCHLQRSLYWLKQAPRAWFQRFASYATRRIIASLHSEFAMTDLGSLNYFLGIFAQRSASGLFLSQSKFAEEILERAHMKNCNPCQTPVDTESKLGSDGDPVCLYMHDPRDQHFTALKRILRYVRATLDYGLQLPVSSTTQLSAYTDADWAGFPVTRRSTSGYCVFLGDNLLSWSAKCQVTLSRSSAEAEYRGVANVVAETA
ncbi:ribonuclease H-like domain-containing protein [Tanacetum coccineum]|uniref:Ribonuclease H-like domain-containing protein n=1 Tax=Tanacetum coccineum TaxID=301880 RepID=A0ABQ5C0L9_9ASTR